MTAYATPDDVQQALQESDAKFGTNELSTGNVEAAIESVSDWFGKQTNSHWYNSTNQDSDYIDNSPRSASNVRLSIASSPHRQRGQLYRDSRHLVYPVTHHGPYTRISLPHLYVQDVTSLRVRDRAGGVTDWVADSDFVEGRGEDYYVERVGQNSYGRTNLYVRAQSMGPRANYRGVLTLDFEYGLDGDSEEWEDVSRGIAALAGAQLVADDDVLAGLPDGASLIGVDTEVQQLVNQAFGWESGGGNLEPYLGAPVA